MTLQRPEKRNALSIDLRVEIAECFARARRGRGGRRDRPHRGRPGVLLGNGHDPVRRRPRQHASGSSRPASPASARSPLRQAGDRRGQRARARRRLRPRPALRYAARRPRTPASASPSCPRGIPPSYAAARAALAGGVAAELTLTGPHPRRLHRAEDWGSSTRSTPRRVDARALELAGRIAAGPRRRAADQAPNPHRPGDQSATSSPRRSGRCAKRCSGRRAGRRGIAAPRADGRADQPHPPPSPAGPSTGRRFRGRS